MEFKRCKRCLMPSTRPGIEFNEDGICYPCLAFEQRKQIDWTERWDQLKVLCDKFRKKTGTYDCLITVSGGKDSLFQVLVMKEWLNMNPLCLMIDNFSWSDIGRKNYYNLSERFGVDMICFTPNRKYMKQRVLEDFVQHLHPARFWDEILYSIPHEFAKRFDIDLVIWGENPALEKGGLNVDDPSNALKQIDSHTTLSQEIMHEALELQLEVIETLKETLRNPKKETPITSIFLDYYVPWSRYENVGFAIVNGLKTFDNVWDREGYEHFPFEQVDTVGYLVNAYSKFIKFGFAGMTELCSDAIRHKVMTREEGLDRVKKYDWKIDPLMIDDFCAGLDISKDEFWNVIDKHANKDLLYVDSDGYWKLKEEFQR